jgi:Ala-tRNA(Pro) deacylase
MEQTVFERLEQLLRNAQVPFQVQRHAPVYTSEEAAAVRGTRLSSGAKALICRTGDAMTMFVLPADRRLNSKAVRKLGIRDLRFATSDEVLALTGLTPGSIPPFGQLFGIATWCDRSLSSEETINFNAGDHSVSVSMLFVDYERVERPRMEDFVG